MLVSRILPRQEVSLMRIDAKLLSIVLQDEHGVLLKVVHGDLQAGDHRGHIHCNLGDLQVEVKISSLMGF